MESFLAIVPFSLLQPILSHHLLPPQTYDRKQNQMHKQPPVLQNQAFCEGSWACILNKTNISNAGNMILYLKFPMISHVIDSIWFFTFSGSNTLRQSSLINSFNPRCNALFAASEKTAPGNSLNNTAI